MLFLLCSYTVLSFIFCVGGLSCFLEDKDNNILELLEYLFYFVGGFIGCLYVPILFYKYFNFVDVLINYL